MRTKNPDDHYLDPEAFAAQAPRRDGSWWPEWAAWLNARSGAPAPPPTIGAAQLGYRPLADAPGSYVLQE